MKTQLKKGFTLVEIMIVVVIIGLLAALAIPAFKKVRNNAIEKTLFNDARQISSAANQFFTEQASAACTAADLFGPSKFIAAMSSGNVLIQGAASANTALAAPALAAFNGIAFASATGTPTNKVFTIGNNNYDTTLSSNPKVTAGYTAQANSLVFAVDTGEILTSGALRIDANNTPIPSSAVNVAVTP